MKKTLVNILIVIAVIILLWIIFVTIDCVRLRNSNEYTYPIIKIAETRLTDGTAQYTGLGYTVSYRTEKEYDFQKPDAVAIGYGKTTAEFRVFGGILIWSYEKDALE